MRKYNETIPYLELLTLEDKQKLEAQFKKVDIIDLDKSMQSYISNH